MRFSWIQSKSLTQDVRNDHHAHDWTSFVCKGARSQSANEAHQQAFLFTIPLKTVKRMIWRSKPILQSPGLTHASSEVGSLPERECFFH